MKVKNLKLIPLHLMAALMASYRRGPARPEMDRTQLAQQRIALVKLDGIGDFVLATGLLRLIERELPQAKVTLFCRRPVGELARQQFPGWSVEEVFDLRNKARQILLDRATQRQIQSLKPFDLLLDLRTYRDFIERTIASWIPARQKIAPANPYLPASRWRRRPLETGIYDLLIPPMPVAEEAGIPRELQNHQALAKFLFAGLTGGQAPSPRLTVSDGEKIKLARRFSPALDAPFLLVCPGARAAIREYPAEELAKAVADAVGGSSLPVVVAGSKQDANIIGAFNGALGRLGIKVLDLTGVLNLAEHLVLISLAQAVLCMETSHAHMAGAVGTPAVVILGGGHHSYFAPWGESPTFRWLTNRLPCFGCNWVCSQPRPICIQDIPPAVIARNLAEVLQLSAGGGEATFNG